LFKPSEDASSLRIGFLKFGSFGFIFLWVTS